MMMRVDIFNMSEDVWPFIEAMSDEEERRAEREENDRLGDREIFLLANEPRAMLVLPEAVSKEFLEYYEEVVGRKVEVWVVKRMSGLVCRDLREDEEGWKKWVERLKKEEKVELVAYSASPQFYEVVEKLREERVEVTLPESPEAEAAWTVNFFGSKSGIRQVVGQSGAEKPNLQMADGMICVGSEDAAMIAAGKYMRGGGVVIKTNKGHSGAGVMILREGDMGGDYEEVRRKIKEALEQNEYWEKFPIVVEDLVRVNGSVGGGCPSVEYLVGKNGKVQLLYYGGMRVTKEGVFKGMEIHESVLPDQVVAEMTDMGFWVGEKFAKAGYRGYFDVDFVVGKDGKMYVTEANVRRTGGTHVYQLGSRLVGKNFWYYVYVLSNNAWEIPGGKVWQFGELRRRLAEVEWDRKKQEGVVIVAENLLRMGKLAYVVFGKNKKRAEELEGRMMDLVKG